MLTRHGFPTGMSKPQKRAIVGSRKKEEEAEPKKLQSLAVARPKNEQQNCDPDLRTGIKNPWPCRA